MANGCVYFMLFTSALGMPLLCFFGYLCSTASPLMELPEDKKPGAGYGCFMAAGLFAATFVGCYVFISGSKSASARELKAM